MICASCGSDNPRTSMECVSCGNKLNTVRCRCGFLNSLMDSYCGSCGKQLIKSSTLSRTQRLESNTNPVTSFSEQELMRLIEIQNVTAQIEPVTNAVSQTDIDKFFE